MLNWAHCWPGTGKIRVNAFEQNRNEVIYAYQNNRNPFIDHPEYADKIWGSDSIEIPTQMVEVNQSMDRGNLMQVYPNPVSNQATISFHNPDHAAYHLIIYDISGRIRKRMNNLSGENVTFERDDLPPGIYLIELLGTENYRGKILIK